jgi:hypothetical protein
LKSAGLAICFFILCTQVHAARISGLITDENSNPLPYVNVFISGTSTGTTANSEGYYTLDLPNGNYPLSFRLIGYKMETREIEVAGDLTIDVQMSPELVKLSEVTIKAGEDPAYGIIRAAQQKRTFYRDQVKMFHCNAYVKSTQRLVSYPKKLFGDEVDLSDILDTSTKIFYLSESVSKLHFNTPDEYHEEMISSKVSGSPRTYSFNKSADVLISFYDNLVKLGNLTPRGSVSPIASDAMLFYNYRLEGSYFENGELVNKITVIPKRSHDPVFNGTIYIASDSWRIYSADLFITRQQQMQFLDTFSIRQNFVAAGNEIWMPFSHQFTYSFNILGFKGDGLVIGVFSDYSFTPESMNFPKGLVLKINDEANKKDSVYWNQARPVPLTIEETRDYYRKDSSRIVHESKSYRDSVDRVSNKFKARSLLTAYSWRNSYKRKEFSIESPLQNIFFNTVEGWNARVDLSYDKSYDQDDRKTITVSPSLRYGLSNTHWNAHSKVEYSYNPKKLSVFIADAGTDVIQFNRNKPISELVNSMYSLLAEKNFMKLYEKRYVSAGHRSELANGFSFGFNLEYSGRYALTNSTDHSFINVKARDFTSNDPLNPSADSTFVWFNPRNAFILEMNFRIRMDQKYIDRPEGKMIIGSKYPTFRINYRKGIHAAGSNVDFDFFQLSVDDEMHFGLLGGLSYLLRYGDFLTKKLLYFEDLKHFNGNKTWFSSFRIDDFKNLEYYTYSTSGPFYELHGEHNFGGFILNKIPLLRKLRLQEIAGVHFLHTRRLNSYCEVSLGIEKLGIIRAELFTSFADGKRSSVGFIVGIKTTFD